ncbi:3 beta-hydroxysteroid dehydrogenase/Delta 5--_4-isomerase type 1-like [Saccostrea cucullata]|uniref:3 beta-hydroxysteroid dehydrogenase/Delta 5-->4-isomerase type 1-like n=1 Tax=Saccostrea cuccullata TaxID=36930 RepID=UPI002ED1722A
MTLRTDRIVVTGGAGFLGQHIVKILQERADYVKEIRVLDLKPFIKQLEYEDRIPLTSFVGSVTDYSVVEKACRKASSVFHVAGLISFGTSPDIDAMIEINVKGTQKILDACVECGVQRLVLCSSVDVVIGFDDIRDGTEQTTGKPSKFLFPGYPETKYMQECMVLQANGRPTVNGESLATVSLRANVMYGEGDQYYVANGLHSAQSSKGTLVQVGNGKNLFQQCYAGNAAWAFLCADKALKSNKSIGGQAFFIPDDTPLSNSFEFMKPFLESRAMALSSYRIPFAAVYWPLVIFEFVLKLISPLVRINIQTASCSVKYINMDLYFRRDKAEALLGYKPIFSPSEAMKMSLSFYKHMKL